MPRSRFLIGSLPWYSVLILTGAALAIWLTERLAKRESLPPDTIVDLALRVLPAGILGARIYYVLFSWDSYRKDPLSVLRIWEGGLAIYGGILAGLIVILIFCRRRQLSILTLCDLIVPGLALAQAIGRWGNYFNMEAYGWTLPEHSALCFFPAAVLIPEGETAHWHLATFFYESICDFGLFLALLVLRKRFRPVKGQLFRFYVFCYAAVRLVIEALRMDSLYSGTVRVSQLLSLLAMALLPFLGVVILSSSAATRTWTGAVSSDWDEPGNWQDGDGNPGVPVDGDAVVIGSSTADVSVKLSSSTPMLSLAT